jgi:hypothetical protein
MHPKAPTNGSTDRQRRISLHFKGNIMSLFSKLLAGAAGVSAAAIALPASAQSYYPPAPTYTPGYGAQGVVGQVINQVLGGGRYGAYGQGNDRVAVDQCARAVEARVSRDNRRGTYGRWNGGYANNQGYGDRNYNQAYGQAQVVGITNVQRMRNGLKVSGLIDTRMNPNLGGYGQYNNPYNAQGQAYPGYPGQGYGQPGYGNQPYYAGYADLRFSCRVDYRGRVADIDVSRNRRG